MLCPTCPKRSYCTSPCDLLRKDLQKWERPWLREILLSAKKLEKVEIVQAEINHWRTKAEEDGLGPKARFYLLYEALKCLNKRQSTCINLYYWEDETQEEIAKTLGISRQAVGQHMEAAHEEIKQFITIFSTIPTCLFAHNVEEEQSFRSECFGVWGALLTKEFLGVDIITPCLQRQKQPQNPQKNSEKVSTTSIQEPVLAII